MDAAAAAIQGLDAAHIGGVAAFLIAAVAFVKYAFPVLKNIGQVLRRIVHFLDDWFGEEARPGVPRRKGVTEKLADLEPLPAQVEVVIGEQQYVAKQLKFNGGGSVKDHTHDTREKVDALIEKVDALIGRVDGLAEKVQTKVRSERQERESAHEEQIAAHEETAEMWRAVQAAHESTPPNE